MTNKPNAERKNAGRGAQRWKHRFLRNRHVLMSAMQILVGVVKLLRALRDLFGGS